MTITFFLRGPARVDWEVPKPEHFSFEMMVKQIRADGHFVASNLYVNAADLMAIGVNQELQSSRKVERLAS